MPNFRRRNSHARSAGSDPLRSSLANAAWAVEDRVVWGTADLLRGLAEVVKWPFERLAWAVEHWVVWPIQEESASWSKPVRAAALAGVVAIAVAGAAAGVIVAGSGGGTSSTSVQASAPAPTPVPATPTTAPTQTSATPQDPVLQGTQPEFATESGGGVHPKEAAAEAAAADATAGAKAAPTTSQSAVDKAASGVSGPAAIAVTRKFANAFVLYETGRTDAAVKKAFAETTTPDLEKALLRRPPRLPANVTVPQAKVVNVVLGPSSGGTQTLSISLLRVGVTSELRVDVQNYKGQPLVADSRG